MNLTVITELLKNTQMTIDTCTSGKQCLEMILKKKYDIIFIDHRMPEMDGIETLEQIRKMDSKNLSGNVPCIALTANAIAGAREQYLQAGFNDYLSSL
jgi:CheY-like chemotaxis protein